MSYEQMWPHAWYAVAHAHVPNRSIRTETLTFTHIHTHTHTADWHVEISTSAQCFSTGTLNETLQKPRVMNAVRARSGHLSKSCGQVTTTRLRDMVAVQLYETRLSRSISTPRNQRYIAKLFGTIFI